MGHSLLYYYKHENVLKTSAETTEKHTYIQMYIEYKTVQNLSELYMIYMISEKLALGD